MCPLVVPGRGALSYQRGNPVHSGAAVQDGGLGKFCVEPLSCAPIYNRQDELLYVYEVNQGEEEDQEEEEEEEDTHFTPIQNISTKSTHPES